MKILSAVLQYLFPSLSPEVFIAQLYKAWRFFGRYVQCYSSADGTGHLSVKHCSRSQRGVAVTQRVLCHKGLIQIIGVQAPDANGLTSEQVCCAGLFLGFSREAKRKPWLA